MGVYDRYKRNRGSGFRSIIELVEGAAPDKRKNMIDIGMKEDPVYTNNILRCLMTYEDVLRASDQDLMEILAKANPRFIAYAIQGEIEEVKFRVLKLSPPRVQAEIDGYLGSAIGIAEVSAAKAHFVKVTRELERTKRIKVKVIPETA